MKALFNQLKGWREAGERRRKRSGERRWGGGVAGWALAVGLMGVMGARELEAQQDWTIRPAPSSYWLKSVAFGGGVFVAVGDEGAILRSSDYGQNWENRSDAALAPYWFKGVGYGDGRFLAVGDYDAAISEDGGKTWRALPGLPEPAAAVAYGGGRWVAVGSTFLGSTDRGTSWERLAGALTGLDLAGIAFQGNTGVAVGSSIYHSGDGGATWGDVAGGAYTWLADVAFGNNLWMTVGGIKGDFLIKTSNPQSWSVDGAYEFWDVARLQGVAYGNNTFVLVGGQGRIVTSSGTSPWLDATSGTVEHFQAVAYGDSTFVVVGDRGIIVTSGRRPEITSPLTATGKVGQTFEYPITVRNGAGSYAAENLPSALQINPQTGVIRGTPTVAETRQVTLRATNPYGQDVRTLTLTIEPGGPVVEFAVKLHTAVELEIPTKVARQYQVQVTRDLVVWEDYGTPFPGTGQTVYRLYTTREATVREYRVREF